MEEKKQDDIFLCPKNNCKYVPEIVYSSEPFNPIVEVKCKSNNHEYYKEKMLLNEFLEKSKKCFVCPICFKAINKGEFCYCKNCNNIFHYFCFQNSNCFKDKNYMTNNVNNLFNFCPFHNNKCVFHCLECNIPLCLQCNIGLHNEKGHTLKQLSKICNNNNNIEKKISNIKKQMNYYNRIINMYQKLIKCLENDLKIKEKIVNNYKVNHNNYQYINNFNNLEVENNEKYEILLNNLLNENDGIIKNSKNDMITEELLINIILCPLYYSLMINKNHNYNNNLITLLHNKINTNNCKYNEKNNIDLNELGVNNLYLMNNNNNLNEIKEEKIKENSYMKVNAKKKENNIKDKDINPIINNIMGKKYEEINKIRQRKSIFNMIILRSGNIATSSISTVTIYDKNKICCSNEQACELQKINIISSRKVSYVYEFPDETLLCSTFGRIYRLKLINNDKDYNILGMIVFEKFELPTILISLGNSFLIFLTELKDSCFIKAFIKDKNYTSVNFDKNNYSNNNNNENKEIYLCYDEYFINKRKVIIDRDFRPYNNNDCINVDRKLLCTLFEIKKRNNINDNNNEYLYEFIATSNSDYSYGEDKIEFYEVKQNKFNKNINIQRIKKLTNISCSTERNSICQLNYQYICIGLQNFNNKKQNDGFALIDVYKREINKIIKGLPICSLCYNIEKKLLFSAIELVDSPNKHSYKIKIYKIIEDKDKIGIDLNYDYEIKSNHEDVIVTLKEINKDNDNKIIIASVSKDSTFRLNEINDF